MTHFTYKTVLKWTYKNNQLIPFYKVSGGVGYVPADIDFSYRNKRYTTMAMIDLLLKRGGCFSFTVEQWYDMTHGTHFNKTLFVKTMKFLMSNHVVECNRQK
jgi:hypothetical protein